jgi:hypothetical protein
MMQRYEVEGFAGEEVPLRADPTGRICLASDVDAEIERLTKQVEALRAIDEEFPAEHSRDCHYVFDKFVDGVGVPSTKRFQCRCGLSDLLEAARACGAL